jgi:hypothetical protein
LNFEKLERDRILQRAIINDPQNIIEKIELYLDTSNEFDEELATRIAGRLLSVIVSITKAIDKNVLHILLDADDNIDIKPFLNSKNDLLKLWLKINCLAFVITGFSSHEKKKYGDIMTTNTESLKMFAENIFSILLENEYGELLISNFHGPDAAHKTMSNIDKDIYPEYILNAFSEGLSQDSLRIILFSIQWILTIIWAYPQTFNPQFPHLFKNIEG